MQARPLVVDGQICGFGGENARPRFRHMRAGAAVTSLAGGLLSNANWSSKWFDAIPAL